MWKVRKGMLGLRTSPRRWQEQLSSKLKEHGFVQDERDPCEVTKTWTWTSVSGCMWTTCWLWGPSEVTKILLQELAKDMAMPWSMVTDKPQEFLGRSLCRSPQRYTFGVSCEYVTQLCKDFVLANSRVPTQSVRRKLLKVIPMWTTLDYAVTDSCLEDYSGPQSSVVVNDRR